MPTAGQQWISSLPQVVLFQRCDSIRRNCVTTTEGTVRFYIRKSVKARSVSVQPQQIRTRAHETDIYREDSIVGNIPPAHVFSSSVWWS
jgi:hypothetical protein